jgi:hypothetical protein
MKVFLYAFFLFCIISNLYSQDTICFINKTSQAVKVHEIGISEIKYHRVELLDGPLYITNRKEIRYIKFANGHVDSITVVSNAKSIIADQPFAVYKQNISVSKNEKILINGSRLSYAGKAVGEVRLMRIINNEPNNEKRGMLLNEYRQIKTYKKKQYLFGIVGLGGAVVLTYAGIIASVLFDAEGEPFFIGFGTGVTVGVTGGIISGIFKHQRTKQKIKVAELYNN